MKLRKAFVAGNWKMNGDNAANEALYAGLKAAGDDVSVADVDIVVCPPYPYLAQAVDRLGGARIAVGAQDLSDKPNGAFTGEVSASILSDVGCRWVIVGHSERRTLFGETDEGVASKIAAALAGGLGVMACVGETLAEREAGRTEQVLARQVDAIGAVLGDVDPVRIVVAYEPVWAIGTGRTASPEMAQQAHAAIRARLGKGNYAGAEAVRIVYGGSVKADNAASLFAMADVDGGLIGGASLVADDFLSICRAAALA